MFGSVNVVVIRVDKAEMKRRSWQKLLEDAG